jgi:two-component system LytT family response regulator
MSLRVLIVDDEAVARRRIRRLLAADPDVTIVGDCADGASAVRAIAAERPDLAFLDVQMPELDGFEVVQSLRPAELPAIVFVTAFDRYALRAFDVHAIDYLLKPFTGDRFRTALARVRQRLDRRETTDIAALVYDLREKQRYAVRVAVRLGDRVVVVDWQDVDWIAGADNYVTLHIGPRELLLRQTLASVERQLDPERFTRIHRSAIVQLDRIAYWRPATHGDAVVVLNNGVMLTLSRTWRARAERLVKAR